MPDPGQRDFHEVLGVPRDADGKKNKDAFKVFEPLQTVRNKDQ